MDRFMNSPANKKPDATSLRKKNSSKKPRKRASHNVEASTKKEKKHKHAEPKSAVAALVDTSTRASNKAKKSSKTKHRKKPSKDKKDKKPRKKASKNKDKDKEGSSSIVKDRNLQLRVERDQQRLRQVYQQHEQQQQELRLKEREEERRKEELELTKEAYLNNQRERNGEAKVDFSSKNRKGARSYNQLIQEIKKINQSKTNLTNSFGVTREDIVYMMRLQKVRQLDNEKERHMGQPAQLKKEQESESEAREKPFWVLPDPACCSNFQRMILEDQHMCFHMQGAPLTPAECLKFRAIHEREKQSDKARTPSKKMTLQEYIIYVNSDEFKQKVKEKKLRDAAKASLGVEETQMDATEQASKADEEDTQASCYKDPTGHSGEMKTDLVKQWKKKKKEELEVDVEVQSKKAAQKTSQKSRKKTRKERDLDQKQRALAAHARMHAENKPHDCRQFIVDFVISDNRREAETGSDRVEEDSKGKESSVPADASPTEDSKKRSEKEETTQEKSQTQSLLDDSYTESKFSASLPAPDLPQDVGGIQVESYTDTDGIVRVKINDDIPMEAIYVPELNAYQYKVKYNGKDVWTTLNIPPPPPKSLSARSPKKRNSSDDGQKKGEKKELQLIRIKAIQSQLDEVEPVEEDEQERFSLGSEMEDVQPYQNTDAADYKRKLPPPRDEAQLRGKAKEMLEHFRLQGYKSKAERDRRDEEEEEDQQPPQKKDKYPRSTVPVPDDSVPENLDDVIKSIENIAPEKLEGYAMNTSSMEKGDKSNTTADQMSTQSGCSMETTSQTSTVGPCSGSPTPPATPPSNPKKQKKSNSRSVTLSMDMSTQEETRSREKMEQQDCQMRPCSEIPADDLTIKVKRTKVKKRKEHLLSKEIALDLKRLSRERIPDQSRETSMDTSPVSRERPAPTKDRSREQPCNRKTRDRSVDKSRDQTAEQSNDRSRDKSTEKSRDRSVDKSREQPAEKEKPKERSRDKSLDKCKEKGRERSMEKGREQTAEKEKSKDRSRDKSRSVEKSREQPPDRSQERSVEQVEKKQNDSRLDAPTSEKDAQPSDKQQSEKDPQQSDKGSDKQNEHS